MGFKLQVQKIWYVAGIPSELLSVTVDHSWLDGLQYWAKTFCLAKVKDKMVPQSYFYVSHIATVSMYACTQLCTCWIPKSCMNILIYFYLTPMGFQSEI